MKLTPLTAVIFGLINPGTMGVAEKQGFDVFFGYYDQKHAHDYYTDYLVRNSVNVPCQQSGKQLAEQLKTIKEAPAQRKLQQNWNQV